MQASNTPLRAAIAFAVLLTAPSATLHVGAQSATEPSRIAPQSVAEMRSWDTTVDRMTRDGGLKLRQRRDDPMLESRTHERFDQVHKGVRVYGADLSRQLEDGLTMSIFGSVQTQIALDDVTPTLTAADAREAIARESGAELPATYEPELIVLPLEGRFVLAYTGRAFGSEGLYRYFIDARTGAVLRALNDLKSQAAIGGGRGVLGDNKKLSINKVGSTYRAQDVMRPPSLLTFDMKGNLQRTLAFLNGVVTLGPNDLGQDSDNAWSDPAVIDAHAYSGYVYDYFYRRFGRRGLDGADLEVVSLVHPVDRNAVLSQPISIVGLFYVNAFYAGDGVMVFGEGLPASLTLAGRNWNYMAGALDIFAHELAHGVTDFSSQLIYENESGALNEAFSDIIAAGAEFYHQAAGNGPLRAEYLMGEDVVTPGGIRSLANPGDYGDPDHYSRRYVGPQDNGGVHINSTIVSHAYYLAIEGGTNRTSGQSVTGIGFANREQMERVSYRAFTQMMPANATFSVARAATLQAAADLYGAGSNAVRALREAWNAVGVN
ncbi:MAG: peptidase M4 family protein [Acidimicrobiia bacterium]|nr:peptidase M4 family protein [Acidimicrobiia bacterium]